MTRALRPIPTDYEVEGPFSAPWTRKTWLWFIALLLSAGGFVGCIAFLIGYIGRSKGWL